MTGRLPWRAATRAAPVAVATFAALCALAATTIVAAPWLRPDFAWDRTSDGYIHLLRTYLVFEALRQGAIYPRWLPELWLGYGYPVLNFYSPGAYYAAAALHAMGLSVYAALAWTVALAIALGATGAAALSLALFPRRAVPAAVASILVVASPYPALSVPARAAVPELLATALLPWVALACWGAWYRGGRWLPCLATTVALLVLTHNLTALLAALLLGAWLLWLWGTAARLCSRLALFRLRRTAIAGAAGAAASAFYWLPALAEYRFVHLELGQNGILDYHTWLFDPVRSPVAPFTGAVSLPQLVLWAGLVILCAALALGARAQRGVGRLALFWLAVAGVCWVCTTTWSLPLWEHAPLLHPVQFPQRFYSVLTLALGLAAAGALAAAPRGAAATLSRAAVVLTAAWVVGSAAASRPDLRSAPPAHDIDERDLIAREPNYFGQGTTSGGEFLPLTVEWPPYASGQLDGPLIYDRAVPELSWQAGLVRVMDGDAAVTGIAQRQDWLGASVTATSTARIAFHQLLFPGWRAFIDGRPAPVSAAVAVVAAPPPGQDTIQASLGFMEVEVPAGAHRVEVRYGATPVRLAADVISGAAVAASAAWLLRRRWPGTMLALIGLAALAGAGAAALHAWSTMRPAGGAPPAASRVALDVLEAVQEGQVDSRSPAGATRGAAPPFLLAQPMRLPDGARRWLFMHPPSEAAVSLSVPADAYFQAGLALDPQTWTADEGDGVRFILEVDAPGGRTTLLDERVDPRNRPDQRRWLDRWASLAPYAGQSVRLILRTDPAASAANDWAGWAHPQVIVWRGARPSPATPHPW